MKKITILLLLIPFLVLSQELKIATYNVDNLFDDINNGTEYDDYKLNTHNWNSAIFKKKIKNIARVICEVDADVIGLQEVENQHALDVLQKWLDRVGCKYRYSAITNKKGGAIQVALLSRVKIKRIKSIKVGLKSSNRDILEVTLDTKPPLTIFVNHWRSKRASESARVRDAKALARRIKKLPKDREYIIVGDFNSRYNECSNLEDKFNDTGGICGIDTILKTYYKKRLITLDDKPNLDFYNYNLWSELDPHKRWSYSFYGKKGAIDSIIISPNLNDNKGWHYKKGSFGVFKKSYLFKRGQINRWEYKHSKHTGYGYSDHLPLYATFINGKSEPKYESLLDKFWKLFIPTKKGVKKLEPLEQNSTKEKQEIEVLDIDELAKKSTLNRDVLLKDVCVVFKRGDIGVIKSSKKSSAITLYRCAEPVEEGKCYDLWVFKKKRYYKIDEITNFKIAKVKGAINPNNFIEQFDIEKLDTYKIGDIVSNIRGNYKDRYLKINGKEVRLFSKVKRRGLFKKGSKLFIKKAQIGYYKGEKELIVYSLKDIRKEN
jgi:endonuclease/exonuclease/phosphatase family metal-dependent hydrolase